MSKLLERYVRLNRRTPLRDDRIDFDFQQDLRRD